MAGYGIPRQLELFPNDDSISAGQNLEISPPPPPFASVTSDSEPELPSAKTMTEQCRKWAATLGLTKLSRRVYVEWNHRMRTAAGRAHYRDARIELNPALIDLPGVDGPGEIDRTLRHELAHLIAHTRAKGRRIQPHGAEWQQACADLGIPDENRCHTLPFEPRRVKRKFLYQCPECASEVPRVRKFRRPVACYACCKMHSHGRYDARFRLHEINDETATDAQVAARGPAN